VSPTEVGLVPLPKRVDLGDGLWPDDPLAPIGRRLGSRVVCVGRLEGTLWYQEVVLLLRVWILLLRNGAGSA